MSNTSIASSEEHSNPTEDSSTYEDCVQLGEGRSTSSIGVAIPEDDLNFSQMDHDEALEWIRSRIHTTRLSARHLRDIRRFEYAQRKLPKALAQRMLRLLWNRIQAQNAD